MYSNTLLAANAIQLPRNPLHYHPPPPPTFTSRRQSRNGDEEDDTDPSSYVPSLGIAQMTLHVLAPAVASRGRQPPLFTTSRTAPPPNRIKAFFDDLVNIPSPDSPRQCSRPRLVYIRDFPTLAPTAPTWYPHLLSAVRARRTGPMARPSSPVACPMAIICGVTPSLVAQDSFGVPPPNPLSASQVLSLGRGRTTTRPSPPLPPPTLFPNGVKTNTLLLRVNDGSANGCAAGNVVGTSLSSRIFRACLRPTPWVPLHPHRLRHSAHRTRRPLHRHRHS